MFSWIRRNRWQLRRGSGKDGNIQASGKGWRHQVWCSGSSAVRSLRRWPCPHHIVLGPPAPIRLPTTQRTNGEPSRTLQVLPGGQVSGPQGNRSVIGPRWAALPHWALGSPQGTPRDTGASQMATQSAVAPAAHVDWALRSYREHNAAPDPRCSPGEAPEAGDPQNWAQRPPQHVVWEGLAQWHLTPQRLQVHQLLVPNLYPHQAASGCPSLSPTGQSPLGETSSQGDPEILIREHGQSPGRSPTSNRQSDHSRPPHGGA